jgi:hypothetical protein
LSPPRSNRGAKPAKAAPAAKAKTRAGSGPRSSSPGLWDEYHTLLAVSLGAIVIGALMLVLVLNKYGFDTSAKGGSAQNAPSLTQSVA